jgi:hypothetical protein
MKLIHTACTSPAGAADTLMGANKAVIIITQTNTAVSFFKNLLIISLLLSLF